MDRDKAGRRGALRPFADPADMAGIAERDCGEARCLGFLNADVDRHRRHCLTEAKAAVDDADHGRINNAFDRLVGNEIASAHPIDVTRHADDAMAVVASQIGVDKRGRRPDPPLRIGSRRERKSRRRSLLAGQREYESSFARHIRIPFDRQYCHSPQMNPAPSRNRFGAVQADRKIRQSAAAGLDLALRWVSGGGVSCPASVPASTSGASELVTERLKRV